MRIFTRPRGLPCSPGPYGLSLAAHLLAGGVQRGFQISCVAWRVPVGAVYLGETIVIGKVLIICPLSIKLNLYAGRLITILGVLSSSFIGSSFTTSIFRTELMDGA